MQEETVEPQQDIVQEAQLEQPIQEVQEPVDQKETHVPLFALQKERKKRQELEYENQLLKEQFKSSVPKEDDSQYESVTRADLKQYSLEIERAIEEKSWIKNNPEKAQKVDSNLEEFLRQKPHLAKALKYSPNRYEEAWELMSALTPKQQQQLKPATQKREPPGSPNNAPKAAAMNQAVDVMSMSDSEYLSWRKAQKRR